MVLLLVLWDGLSLGLIVPVFYCWSFSERAVSSVILRFPSLEELTDFVIFDSQVTGLYSVGEHIIRRTVGIPMGSPLRWLFCVTSLTLMIFKLG